MILRPGRGADRQLATAGLDQTVRLWDPDTGQTMAGMRAFGSCISVAVDSSRVWVAGMSWLCCVELGLPPRGS
jgi:hypothetical protein